MPLGSPTQSEPQKLSEPIGEVECFLTDFVDGRALPANLRDAIKYALLGGGKRLRPIMTVRCCEAVGGQRREAMAPGGAIELIHCFSLVHDDLPAMDDDDLRRGRPTLHKQTNEAMAILGGDAMMGLAFELLATKVEDVALSGRLTLELATATNDMIAGQVYDTLPLFPEKFSDMDRLQTIHRHKTGALLRCACRMGAIAGRATDDQLNAITAYAEAVGLMFQVVDDLLDVTQTTEQLGKTAGKDSAQGKLTYPGLIGLEATRQEITKLQKQAHEALADFDHQADPLRALCDYMAVRSN